MLLLLFTQGRGAWPSLGLPVSATLWPPRHPCSETAKGIGPARGVPPGRATRRPFRPPNADSVVYMSSSGQPSWLAKFAGVEYAKWPPWAKAKFTLCRVAVSGAAATSVGAADRGISVPRGGATSELSGQLGLATSTWSPTVSVRRRLRAAAIALLPAPNGEDAAEAPEEETVVCASCDGGDDPPGLLSSAELDGLCEAACDAGDALAATPAPPRPPVGSIDFALENPVKRAVAHHPDRPPRPVAVGHGDHILLHAPLVGPGASRAANTREGSARAKLREAPRPRPGHKVPS